MNGKYILKSGTDFRQFSVVTLDFGAGKAKEEEQQQQEEEKEEKDKKKDKEEEAAPPKLEVEVEMVEVTAEAFRPDEELAKELEKFTGLVGFGFFFLCRGKKKR